MLTVGKFIPPKQLPYSFLKDLYGIHKFSVNCKNTYYNTQIVNVPFNIVRGVFTQESVSFPQPFYVDVVVLAPFEVEVNTQRIQGYSYLQLGSQSVIAVKGLGQVLIWVYQNFSFPSYVPFEYIFQNDYAYDVYLHTLGLHEAVLKYLNYGKEIPDVFFEESGINEVLYYLKHGCVRNREKFALGVVILQILYPYNPFNLPYGQSYGETYQNALQIPSCYDQLSEEISETQSELIQDSELLQSEIYELSENLIETSENLQDQINYLSEILVETQYDLMQTSEYLQSQINELSDEIVSLESEVVSEESQIQTLFSDFYQVSECCYSLSGNVVIQLAEVVQCLVNIVLNILTILPPGLVKKIIGNLTACPLGSELQVLESEINELSETSEVTEILENAIEGIGHGLGHKLHRIGRGLGHLMRIRNPFEGVTEDLLEALSNLLSITVNASYSDSESNSSSESNNSNSTYSSETSENSSSNNNNGNSTSNPGNGNSGSNSTNSGSNPGNGNPNSNNPNFNNPLGGML